MEEEKETKAATVEENEKSGLQCCRPPKRINIDIYFLKYLTKIQGAWYNQSLVCRKDENTLLLILELV